MKTVKSLQTQLMKIENILLKLHMTTENKFPIMHLKTSNLYKIFLQDIIKTTKINNTQMKWHFIKTILNFRIINIKYMITNTKKNSTKVFIILIINLYIIKIKYIIDPILITKVIKKIMKVLMKWIKLLANIMPKMMMIIEDWLWLMILKLMMVVWVYRLWILRFKKRIPTNMLFILLKVKIV
jgi:hypothetical protein